MKIENNGIESVKVNTLGNSQKNDSSSLAKKSGAKIKEVIREVQNNVELKKHVEEHEVIQAIEKANKHFKSYDRRLEFSIHEQTKQIMVKVIDTDDDSIVREIPSEKILDMVAKLWEMAGIFVDEKR